MSKKVSGDFLENSVIDSESIDFHQLLRVFASRWYWIVGALIIAGSACFLYLKLVTPLYETKVNLKYLDKQSQLDEITTNSPTYIFNSANSDYLTEKYVVNSPEVVERAIISMRTPFTFYRLKDLRKINVYPNKPVYLELIGYDPEKYEGGTFKIDESLNLTYRVGEEERPLSLTPGKVITLPGLSFKVKSVHTAKGYEYQFVYNDPIAAANQLAGNIGLEEVEEFMPVLELSFRSGNAAFTKDFTESLLAAYREYDLRQKQKSSDLTIRFIGDQLKIYMDSLKVSSQNLEVFKQQNQIYDINTSATELMEKLRDLEKERQTFIIQKSYVDILEKNMSDTFEPINYLSIGLDAESDAMLAQLLQTFNAAVSRRKELLLKFSPNNAAVKNVDEELEKLRTQILHNISLQKQKNSGTLKILNSSIASMKQRFNRIPGLEKNYLYLLSNFEVNKNIYSMLLNKDIESSISRAGILPSFEVISKPTLKKVSPKPLQIVPLFIFLGLLLGFGSVLLARSVNTKFNDLSALSHLPNAKLLGIVHHFGKNAAQDAYDLEELRYDRSVFTESMSALRTKLSFLKTNLDPKEIKEGRQILITSERSGEGKTFVTVNLGLSLNKIEKKVVILGMDLRKSKLNLYFNSPDRQGISEYLQNDKIAPKDIICHSTINGLDYVLPGSPPFNPGEILQKPRFTDLLDLCRQQYDFVLLDTAPIGLVADCVPFLRTSDQVIFITRWLYSGKNTFRLADEISLEYDVPNVQVIVNDYYPDALHAKLQGGGSLSEYSHYRYDNAYKDKGYYMNGHQTTFLSRIKRKLSKTNDD